MRTPSQTRKIVAAHIRRRHDAARDAWEKRGQPFSFAGWMRELGLERGGDEMMMRRQLRAENGGSAETFERIAKAFGIETWELLHPGQVPAPKKKGRAAA